MNNIKKTIALILSLLMIIAVSPVCVSAQETEPEAAWYSSYGVMRGSGTIHEAISSVDANGKIVLLDNIDGFIAEASFTKNVLFNGNGYTITRSEAYAGKIFTISGGATVTFTDVTINGNSENYAGQTDTIINITDGTVILDTGAHLTSNSARTTNGGAVRVNSTVDKSYLYIKEGAEISECFADNGGAVYLGENGYLVMEGGKITDCTASYNGGAVAVDSTSASFSMTGGEITECSASARSSSGMGGAVYANLGTVSISAGSVTANSTNSDLGAVYISASVAATIGGSAYIYGNEGNIDANNIYVDENAAFRVSPSFAPGAKLGVTAPYHLSEDLIDMSFIGYNGDMLGFVYDDVTGQSFYKTSDSYILIECITVTFDPGNGVCDVESKVYAVDVDFDFLPECEEREGFNFLGWYTSGGMLITEDTAVTFYDDITLYAEWENLNKLDDGPFAVIGRFFERIGDLLRMVFDFLENLFVGGGDSDLDQIK